MKILFALLWIVPCCLSSSVIRQKLGPNHFLTETIASVPKICVFNNLISVTEMILQLPQKLSQYLLEPDYVSLEFCHTRETQGKKAEKFYHRKNSLSLNFLFLTTLSSFWINFSCQIAHCSVVSALVCRIRKREQSCFFHRETSPFSINFSIDLLHFKEMIF